MNLNDAFETIDSLYVFNNIVPKFKNKKDKEIWEKGQLIQLKNSNVFNAKMNIIPLRNKDKDELK